jgi:cytochrome c553/cytochrome c5
MKRDFIKAAFIAPALALIGALVAASGVVPIKASSGHWKLTEALLQFSKRRSIATHTLGAKPPAAQEGWLSVKGAGHYETGCRPCHGGPGFAQPRIARAMTPPPPQLADRVANYEPEELFYIVKHGIKFTGMPAWPSLQRDDEVHAMVAFLRELPRLDAAGYRRLVHGDTHPAASPEPFAELQGEQVPALVEASCARCHGVDGQGRGTAAFPKLAGQRREYLWAALEAFATDQRHSGIMQPIAAGLGSEERLALANYYSRRGGSTSAGASQRATSPADERGRLLANDGVPSQGVPSCVDCHGPSGQTRNPAYPLLAGQYAEYLVLQLELFKEGRRGGSPYAHLMARVAARMTPAQMRDVARYYASLSNQTAR